MTIAPTIEFYLTPQAFDWTDAVYMQSHTFPSLLPGQRIDLENFPLTIPANTPSRKYFVTMLNVTAGDQLGDNDYSWLHNLPEQSDTMYVHSAYTPKVWTGLTNGNWNDVGNWADYTLPTALSDVTIPAGCPDYPNVNNIAAHTKNLTVENGARLSIVNIALTVQGDLQVAGNVRFREAASELDVLGNALWQSGSTVTMDYPSIIRCGGNWTFMSGSTAQFSQGTVEFNLDTSSSINCFSDSS